MNSSNKVVIESQTNKFLQNLALKNNKDIMEMPLEEARIEALAGQIWNYEKLPAEIRDIVIDTHHGQIELRLVRPKDCDRLLPVVMYFHGGGWVLNNKDAHDRLIRQISNGSDAMVAFVEYSRSPEAKYPIALEEAYSATQWMADNGQKLGADTARIAVAGDSSGANMAAVVAILAKQRGGPKLLYQLLITPTLNADFETSSYRQFEEGYFLTRRQMMWFWDQYAPDHLLRSNISLSPLRATSDDLKDLPPALIITAEADVLRDEGEEYARKLMQAGVDVTATRYLGTIHGFVFLNDLAKTPASIAAVAQAGAMLKKYLSGTSDNH